MDGPIPTFSSAEAVILQNINERTRVIDMALRGDGSSVNPGIIIQLDRVSNELAARRKREEQHRVWLWGITASMLVMFGQWVLQSFK